MNLSLYLSHGRLAFLGVCLQMKGSTLPHTSKHVDQHAIISYSEIAVILHFLL